MQTGGLVTETDISRTLLERLGASIERRAKQDSRRALLASREREDLHASAVVLAGTSAEPRSSLKAAASPSRRFRRKS